MSTVEINQVGPIDHLEIPVPAGGGVCVLRGRNGCGKTIAIDTAQRLLGGKSRPAASDGADKGTVEGWGARLTVAQRVTSSGTLEAASLEGSFDLAALVDPGIDDPAAADTKRTKALLSLLGIQASDSLFTPRLLPEEVYTGLGVAASDDLVEMAGRVKRKLEEEARTHGKSAENHRTKADGLAGVVEFTDVIERDSNKLQQQLEAAISDTSRLTEQIEGARQRVIDQDQARAKLAELPPSDLAAAEKEAKLTAGHFEDSKAVRAAAERAYEEALNADALASRHLADQQLLAEHRETYESLLTEKVSEADVTQLTDQVNLAGERVNSARTAMELGVKARDYDDRQAKSKTERRRGMEAQSLADLYRNAAHGIDMVLTDAVAGLDIGLFVENGRLCVNTVRGVTSFGELSHGERWKMSLDLGVRRVGARGVLAIPQEAWEGLDYENREAIHQHAKSLGVVVLTAEATDGELRAESLG